MKQDKAGESGFGSQFHGPGGRVHSAQVMAQYSFVRAGVVIEVKRRVAAGTARMRTDNMAVRAAVVRSVIGILFLPCSMPTFDRIV